MKKIQELKTKATTLSKKEQQKATGGVCFCGWCYNPRTDDAYQRCGSRICATGYRFYCALP